MADFTVPAYDRVQLALTRHLHQIPAILGQRFIILLRVLARHPLAAPDTGERLQNLLPVYAVLPENLCTRRPCLVR